MEYGLVRTEYRLSLFDLVSSLAETIDLMSPNINSHHAKVSYIAFCIGNEIGLSDAELSKLSMAGALHDIGALSLRQRLDALDFEMSHTDLHAEAGYRLLCGFEPFSGVAELVRTHHSLWSSDRYDYCRSEVGGCVLHLADRISALLDSSKNIYAQVPSVTDRITSLSGKTFSPDLVRAFSSLSGKKSFWQPLTSAEIRNIMSHKIEMPEVILCSNGIEDLSRLFSRLIDFRSQFTATHSAAVALVAEMLADYAGFSDNSLQLIKVSGYLHDLGKLAVPLEILEKPGPLTADEFRQIKQHPIYTYRILEHLPELSEVKLWSSYHHERSDGYGYPFGISSDDIPLGSHIIAVADIFATLSEDRPYRKGYQPENIRSIIKDMIESGSIHQEIGSLLLENIYEATVLRHSAQIDTCTEYELFMSGIHSREH